MSSKRLVNGSAKQATAHLITDRTTSRIDSAYRRQMRVEQLHERIHQLCEDARAFLRASAGADR